MFTLLGLFSFMCTSLYAQDFNGVYREADMSEIRASGWFKEMLETQRDGFTTHMKVMRGPYELEGWGPYTELRMDEWSKFEQTGYWADGALRCGYLIDDSLLLQTPKSWIYYQIENADEDGFIGPKHIANLWPEVVFFRAVMAEYTATKDPAIIDALVRNYHGPKYEDLMNAGNHDFNERMMLHVEMFCWLYARTGDSYFLDKAEETYEKFNQRGGPFSMQNLLSDSYPRTHSVSYCENLKIPAILYIYTGNRKYLEAAENAVYKVYKYHGLADGLPSGNELHDGKFSNEVHETCTVSDMQWALGYLLQATGNVKYADLIETICFNAALGSVTKDFKAFQYYSGPNQVIAGPNASPWNCFEYDGNDRASYCIAHGPHCCGGNINRMLPLFGSRMWMKKGNDGVVAALYAPSVFTTKLDGEKNELTIREETNYPFEGTIRFVVETKKATEFSLWLRIPEWGTDAQIMINGKASNIVCNPGTYVEVRRKFRQGDVVELNLPMEPRIEYLPENALVIKYGPLLYSYSIPANVEIRETREDNGVEFHTYTMKPAAKWNYAPIDTENIKVIKTDDFSDPWNPEKTPVKLGMDVVEVTNWLLYRDKFTPVMPFFYEQGEKSYIELVPMGATLLRVSIFPDLNKTYSSK